MFRLLAVAVGLNGICAVTRAGVTKEDAGAKATTCGGAARADMSNAVKNLMVVFWRLE
jgi:hypothetical protein